MNLGWSSPDSSKQGEAGKQKHTHICNFSFSRKFHPTDTMINNIGNSNWAVRSRWVWSKGNLDVEYFKFKEYFKLGPFSGMMQSTFTCHAFQIYCIIFNKVIYKIYNIKINQFKWKTLAWYVCMFLFLVFLIKYSIYLFSNKYNYI